MTQWIKRGLLYVFNCIGGCNDISAPVDGRLLI